MKNYDYHHLNHVKEQLKSKKTLWTTFFLTIFFTVVEIVGGIKSHSLALLSDSAHMLSDVIALGLSITAIYLATKNPNKKYTYGYLRFEIIASFLNGLALIIIAIGICIEGIKRIINPTDIDLHIMLIVSSIGLLINIILTYILIRSMRVENNLNVKSALWHFIGDLLNSIGVIISGVIIYYTNFTIIDPIISMVISVVIFIGGLKITRESYQILMESVPNQFDLDLIRQDIKLIEGVEDVHEMHLWSITTEHYCITAHIFLSKDCQSFLTVASINQLLKEKYGLLHATIQVEHPSINEHGEYGKEFLEHQ
ncbi:cation diffusion facilitator family transporter [Gottfriedia luciferensis]|uniref:cation diffusion facilitator family transporter n=1 Tax=Gottfriedia luciferensis TaxID=178774 RepID=UPI000B43C642|nr:cation diffusion facilitator family transporter [Gottfriedia luciferensis]